MLRERKVTCDEWFAAIAGAINQAGTGGSL